MSDSELNGIERSILSYLLFGSKEIGHHPDYIAFSQGFNFPISSEVTVLDVCVKIHVHRN